MKFLFRFISGRHGGTPLHHAAKRGLLNTVKLLLFHGDVARVKGNVNVVKAIEDYIVYSLVGCGSFTGQDLLKCLFLSCFQEKFGWLFYQLVPEIIQNLSSWSWPYILLCRMLKHLKMSKAVMMQNKILKK
ncbi:putative E3 ubiquitin-protein ligase XBAT35 isoform X4 [Gossypium hirsutum]|uniref:E3 ubiquitin-protein ligase XBAT35 isoform X4 n=1 Tax=Gossypium hirsutum TaxID=3635 RepID=A0ABM2Z8Q7_GOSHI|nr:putative E3 ubiquitin-protein ligase XBAT35 isoform X4 [Gossypium hirsutum]